LALSPSISILEAKVPCAPAEQRGQHLAGLVGIVVDRLLAEDDQPRLFSLDHALQNLGDAERLDRLVDLDQDGAVGAHGKRGA
jgi:hypothetical protein